MNLQTPPPAYHDPLLQEITAYLHSHYGMHSAYLLGKQTTTATGENYLPHAATSQNEQLGYTLLILTHKPLSRSNSGSQNPAQLMDDVYNRFQKQARTWVVPYTVNAAMEKLAFGCNFLARAINQAPCVFKEDDCLKEYKNFTPGYSPAGWKEIRKQGKVRFERAAYLLATLERVDHKEDAIALFGILKHALEQTCMGLIYVFWELKPGYTSLPYLLHLCGRFTDLPDRVFPKGSYTSHRVLHGLQHAHHYMQYNGHGTIPHRETRKARNRVTRFLEEAEKLATGQLGHLKTLAHKKSL